ncbi:MAG TPA: hypothetical protein VF637_17895 [Sphingomicrobium sp.]
MTRSATETVHDIINAAVVDAIIALRVASKGLPNALLRDVNAIHANTAFGDLPEAVRSAVASSVRDAFTKLQKDGYVVAEANSAQVRPARQDARAAGGGPAGGQPRSNTRPPPQGRPRPSGG